TAWEREDIPAGRLVEVERFLVHEMLNTARDNLPDPRGVPIWEHRTDGGDDGILRVHPIGWIRIPCDASDQRFENALGQVALLRPVKVRRFEVLDSDPFLLVAEHKTVESVRL